MAHRAFETVHATAIWLFRSCITIYNCSQLARTRIYSHHWYVSGSWNMVPKVFLYVQNPCRSLSTGRQLTTSSTGATGYIGGDALYALFKAHPDWEYTCIVRNAGKGAKIAAAYPKVRLVYGNLDSTDLLEEEAGKADIIYRTVFEVH